MLCLKEGRAVRNRQKLSVIVLVPNGNHVGHVLGQMFREKEYCLGKKIIELPIPMASEISQIYVENIAKMLFKYFV